MSFGRDGVVSKDILLRAKRGLMDKVRSSDGTTIAFDRLGAGTPVILVSGGASTGRAIHAQLAELLAADFTVLNYDRRGRGDSGDTPPYAIEREIQDLNDVITEAGGAAALFGNSSGAVLALHAAAAGLPVTKLALWEPPFMLDPDAPRRQREYVAQLTKLLEAGRRGDAMALFMKTVGLPGEMIAGMRQAPMWSGLEALAHTLAYDAAIMGDGMLPTGLVASIKAPTLVLDGSDTGAWAADSAKALSAALPNAQRRTLTGQNHNVASDVLAPVLGTSSRSEKSYLGKAGLGGPNGIRTRATALKGRRPDLARRWGREERGPGTRAGYTAPLASLCRRRLPVLAPAALPRAFFFIRRRLRRTLGLGGVQGGRVAGVARRGRFGGR